LTPFPYLYYNNVSVVADKRINAAVIEIQFRQNNLRTMKQKSTSLLDAVRVMLLLLIKFKRFWDLFTKSTFYAIFRRRLSLVYSATAEKFNSDVADSSLTMSRRFFHRRRTITGIL